jgi:hypothetical protein
LESGWGQGLRFEYAALRRGFGHGGKLALNTSTSTDAGSIPEPSSMEDKPARRGACFESSAHSGVSFDCSVFRLEIKFTVA